VPLAIAVRPVDCSQSRSGCGISYFHKQGLRRKNEPQLFPEVVVTIPGYDCDSWDGIARQLAAAGISALALDMRGFGRSGGTPSSRLTDAERAKVRAMRPGDVETAFQYLVSQPSVKCDVIGVGGNPIADITELERIRFVMKDSHVIKNSFPSR
jgi:pimeloyl-ACP methyl ester carboxylesterase